MKKVKVYAYIDVEDIFEFDDEVTEDEIEDTVCHFVNERLDVAWKVIE
jgi:hypothetical protein